MTILTEEQLASLKENGKVLKEAEDANQTCRLVPQALLFLPGTNSKWMLAYISPDDPDLAFGLMQLEGGTPELGFVRLSELEMLKGYRDKGVVHDPMFKDAAPLDVHEYADLARMIGQITLQFNVKLDN